LKTEEFWLVVTIEDGGRRASNTPPRRKSASCWTVCAASAAFQNSAGAKALISKLRRSAAGGELEEQGAIESARAVIIDIFDAGRMTQAGGSGACLEPLLSAQRRLVFEDQTEPFCVIEATSFGIMFEFLEPLGHAMKAENT
jgi:hypothetical protein